MAHGDGSKSRGVFCVVINELVIVSTCPSFLRYVTFSFPKLILMNRVRRNVAFQISTLRSHLPHICSRKASSAVDCTDTGIVSSNSSGILAVRPLVFCVCCVRCDKRPLSTRSCETRDRFAVKIIREMGQSREFRDDE